VDTPVAAATTVQPESGSENDGNPMSSQR
jgi:hypothetical protein